LAKKKNIYHK